MGDHLTAVTEGKHEDFSGKGWIGGEGALVTQAGQIYLAKERQVPVRVLGSRDHCWTGEGYVWLYPVENILTGENYHLPRKGMSKDPLNEMEVIAWASK
jgi:hypothetical protein